MVKNFQFRSGMCYREQRGCRRNVAGGGLYSYEGGN